MRRDRVPSDGEVVVVTGASAGVGRAIAHAFARRGARIGLIARGREGLEAACEEVRSLGGDAITLPTDITDGEQVERAAAQAEEAFGPIDVWVNDAMATVFAEFTDISEEEFTRATAVTYLGTANGTRSALRRMIARDRGCIVQVGSALSYRSIPLQSAYCGAKFAVRGMTDSIRTELMHRKSRVWITMVQLPAVNTPQFDWCRNKLPHHPQPVPPIYQPEVPAEVVYQAAHQRRRELWCGGSTVAVIVGNKLAPAIADRYLARTGFDSQQVRDMPAQPRGEDNLFRPVPELAATHGMFDDRAHSRSLQAWLTSHRGRLAGAAASLVVAGSSLLSLRQGSCTGGKKAWSL
jgi:NAD(P)-dependent dehydrogenase (short-subunit alcohol dehydrogenase family)